MPDVGFRFRAYTNSQTLRALKAQLRMACELYNTLRWADSYFYARDGKGLNQTQLRQLALDLRKQDGEYKQMHSQVAQNVADRFYEARERFFKGLARFPKERKPHRWYSLVYPQSGWKVLSAKIIRKNSREAREGHPKKLMKLSLSHLGVFKVLVHRDFPLDKVKRVIVKLMPSGRIYISFVVDYEFPKLPQVNKVTALDVGIKTLIMTSDGEYFPNMKPYEKALWKVKHLHRILSRKKFLSKNWFKAKVKLAKAYEHLKNLRKDLYMRLGKHFARNYDVLVMEDIQVKKLVGNSLRRMRMRLHDVAFHELKMILKYQMEKHGKSIALVDPAYTSKTCAKCGYVKEDLTLLDRVFSCPRCGWITDRDYNASLNILRRSGSVRPLGPVEFRPLPVLRYWQGGARKQEAQSVRAG
ncbi:RNA-guided endonuclease InsQ/TnpB family protein [Metallosphaera hakonensis]|uniref:Transposase n=1 Tax=Metallosphaera hakonensis JCM 8857 = DSM 7519 TaxID=1293036 RepID=A0A2U9IWQ6_9CREN|nr:RNA-guided endonuclease TnpB family protein [Metallosphaera hakonensis]AWS00384.1 IS200/IS605 family element transposase accessory protein TnpB [Metallosphaera hakonensis JCM 8857 = DSM 7519]